MRSRSFVLGILFVVSFVLVGNVAVYAGAEGAGKCRLLEKATSDSYGERAPARLLHGLANAALGWTQIIQEPIHAARGGEKNAAEGLVEGIGMALYYTANGVWDVATFWVPGSWGKEIASSACICQKMKS